MSLGRRGMASPALAAVASRHARFLLLARVSEPSVAFEDIAEGVVCASLCVEASEKGKKKEETFFSARPFIQHSNAHRKHALNLFSIHTYACSASTNQLRCALSCRAAGYFISRGTPTRSRRYASASAAGAPLCFPCFDTFCSLGATDADPSRSSCTTLRSAASTSFTNSSPGLAVGSERGAPNCRVPFFPHPRAAKRTTFSALATTECAASSRSATGFSPHQLGSGRECFVSGGRGSLQWSNWPSMAAANCFCVSSPFASHPPSCGGKS
mmetsp:Transcript_2021/g.6963  ORF Transcript_2021/g.6963 Transcript_2021/m.6963 type:complete len:270 (+) Transcript_2021:333-1142(+)